LPLPLAVRIWRQRRLIARALDALVGCGAALLVGVVLFPAAPLPQLWAAERAVLESLADAVEQVSQRRRGTPDRATGHKRPDVGSPGLNDADARRLVRLRLAVCCPNAQRTRWRGSIEAL
jgi:uncharacterized membrane protein YccC